MNHMTASNLRSAFGGESQAHMRYRIWGDKATRDGFPNVGRLFMATSDAEQVHATLHFRALRDEEGDFDVTSTAGFGLGTTSENLQGGINGEMFEVEQMYPAYIAVAEMQEEKQAVAAMKYAIEAEKTHAELFTVAKEAVDSGSDLKVEDKIYLCPVCGYITLEDTDESCPLCNAKRELFVEY